VSTARAFVVTHGENTLASETIARTSARVDSTFVDKRQGLRIAMSLELDHDALVSRADIAVFAAAATVDSPPLQRARVVFEDDAVLVYAGAEASAPVQRVPVARRAMPFLNLSMATAEQIFMRAKAIGGAVAEVPVFAVVGGSIVEATVAWKAPDSAALTLGGVEMRARLSDLGEIIDAEVPLQGVRFAQEGAASAPMAASAAPKADYSAPPGAPYTAEEVRVRNERGGVALAGTLTIPQHARGERLPAVVMITGSGAQDRDEATPVIPGYRPFREIADALSRRGIAVLRMDDRGVGGSDAGPFGATSADFADDIRAALDFLRARDDIASARLALIGHSEGGIIAPMIAATDPLLRAIVIVAGPSRPGRVVSDQQVRAALAARGLTGAQLESEIAANARVRDLQVDANPWLRFWFEHDPIPTACRVTQPVLIVHGATDTQVTPDQAEELAAAFRSNGNRDVTLRILPEINHLMVHDPSGGFTEYGKLASLSVSPVVLATIGDWLATQLR
jgi:dipeptidyl aminopeptidase/acylaminoacyl peptidase